MDKIKSIIIVMSLISLMNCNSVNENPFDDPDCGKEIEYTAKDFRDFSYIIDLVPKEIVLIEKFKDSTFSEKLSHSYEKLLLFGSDGSENYSFSLSYPIDSRFSYRFYFADTNDSIYKYDLSNMKFKLVCLATGDNGSQESIIKTEALVSYILNGRVNADPDRSSVKINFNEAEKIKSSGSDSILREAEIVSSSQWKGNTSH